MSSSQLWSLFGKDLKVRVISAALKQNAEINVNRQVNTANMSYGKKDPQDNLKQLFTPHSSWWRTERPLTSRRVKVLLSESKESAKLLKAIRASRSGSTSPFRISAELKAKLMNK
jgi:hypothetical protein